MVRQGVTVSSCYTNISVAVSRVPSCNVYTRHELSDFVLENVEPGKVVEVNHETSQLVVKCADGCLRVSFDEKEFSENHLYNLEYL